MLTRPLRGRGALLAASLICLSVCVGCGEIHTRTTLGTSRGLVIALDGQPSALFAPIFEAQANGDFGRGALNVTVLPSGRSPLDALESGRAALAVVSEPSLLSARDQGAQLVAIGALVQGPLESIISLPRHPITTPAQLAGQTIATDGSALSNAELESVLATPNLASAHVHTITVTGELDNAIQAHKATASLGGLWNYDAVALTLAHQRPSVIRLSQTGIPSFSDLVVVARVGEAHSDGPLLRAFLQSLSSGERAVRANPAATAQLLARLNPSLSERFELAVLQATAPVTQPAHANEPFGFQAPTTWRAFGEWMRSHGLLTRPGDGALAITNEFLPGQGE